MDKGCANCSHAGTPNYKSPCSECVASGMFSGWEAGTCENCRHRYKDGGDDPCAECFEHKGYPMWERMLTDAELKAKDEPKGDTLISERMCVTCEHSEVGKDEEPCKTCIDSGNERSMWEPESKPESNPVRPAHYEKCSLECIDVMLAVFGRKAVTDFCIVNAFKYMWRYEHKNGLEDLQKAERYLAMATTFQTGDTEHEIRIIYMQEELEILMRRVSK